VGLCSNNRLEWLIADLACIFNGYVVVPIHHVLGMNIVHILCTQSPKGEVLASHHVSK
jgi:long-subunit acyl-CoA synthetase (AMP-forming)